MMEAPVKCAATVPAVSAATATKTGLAGEVQRVETTAGLVIGQRIDKRLYRIRLNDPAHIRLDIPIEANGVCYTGSYMESGRPRYPPCHFIPITIWPTPMKTSFGS